MKEEQLLQKIRAHFENEGLAVFFNKEDMPSTLAISIDKDQMNRERILLLKCSLFLIPHKKEPLPYLTAEIQYLFPFGYKSHMLSDIKSFLFFLNSESFLPGFNLLEGEEKICFRYPVFIREDLKDLSLLSALVGMVALHLNVFAPLIEELAEGKTTFDALIEQLLTKKNETPIS